jgi:hypothetical protein
MGYLGLLKRGGSKRVQGIPRWPARQPALMHSKRTESQPLVHRPIAGEFASLHRGHWASSLRASSSDHSTSFSARPNYRPFGHAFDWLTLTSASFQHQRRTWHISFLTLQSRFLRRQQCTEMEDDHGGKGGGLTATSDDKSFIASDFAWP